jgi:ribosomal protein S18 acetylase RimI-like enzyme
MIDVNGKTTGRIEDVVTHEDHRGQGIGRALMTKIIWYARESGCSIIDLTSRRGRDDGRKLYRKLGFKRRDTNVYRLEL